MNLWPGWQMVSRIPASISSWLKVKRLKNRKNNFQSQTLREGVGDKMNTIHHPTIWAQNRFEEEKNLAAEEFESITKGYRIKKGPKKNRQVFKLQTRMSESFIFRMLMQILN